MPLLCTCLGETVGPRPTCERRRLPSSMGPVGGLGLGTVWDWAEPLLLTSTQGLHLPGSLPAPGSQIAAAAVGALPGSSQLC